MIMKGYEIKRIANGESSIIFGKFFMREYDARKEANRLSKSDRKSIYKVVKTEA